MSKVLLDHRGDVLKYLQDEGDSMFEVTVQDINPLLEHVKLMRETHVQDHEMYYAGEIPIEIVEEMIRDGRWNDPAAIKAWLNDPQNECFRVWKGKL